MPFWKQSEEEKAAKAQRKAEKKAQAQQRLDEFRVNHKVDREQRKTAQTDGLKALLQEGETLDGMFRTGGVLVKKHVLVTSRRLIVGLDAKNTESIFYRHIAGVNSSNFITKDLSLVIAGRKDKLELSFAEAEDRDRLLDLISGRLVAE